MAIPLRFFRYIGGVETSILIDRSHLKRSGKWATIVILYQSIQVYTEEAYAYVTVYDR